jgi:hypothetical protein
MNHLILAIAMLATSMLACGDGPTLAADAHVADSGTVDTADASIPDTPSCRSGWCWVYPLPQGNQLNAVWSSAPDDVWAVGDYNTAIHFDGVKWTEIDPPIAAKGRSDLMTLWGSGPDDVWVGGSNLAHWNGTAWTSFAEPASQTSAAVVGGSGSNDVWKYDFTANQIRQWNGAAWSDRPLPAANWRPIAFWGDGNGTFCVSTNGGIAKWLGSAWGILDGGSHPAKAATFIDASHLILVGDAGAVWFWDGVQWTPHFTDSRPWGSVVASGVDDVWVAPGFNFENVAELEHWDGTAWTTSNTGASGGVRGMWRDNTGLVWAVHADSQVRVWNGVAWTGKTTGSNEEIDVAWGTSPAGMWGAAQLRAGGGIRTSRWEAGQWTTVTNPFETGHYLLGGTWGSSATDYWIAAGLSSGQPDVGAERFMLHWNGLAWSVFGPYGRDFVDAGFTAVWGAGPDDVYATSPSAVYHFDGQAWSLVTGGPSGGDAVFGSGATDVYVAKGSALWHWNGASWTSRTSPTPTLHGWASSSTDVWLGQDTVTKGNHFDGALFTPMDIGGQPVGTDTDMFAVFYDQGVRRQLINHWIGGFGTTPEQVPAFFIPQTGWRTSDGRLYVVSHGAVLVHE